MEISRRTVLAGLAATTIAGMVLPTGIAAATPEGDLTLLSIQEAAERIKAGTLLPADLVEAYFRRIDAIDAELRSFIYVAREEALIAAEAAAADIKAGKYKGPLHGIPYGIKDLYFTGSIPTSGNSRIDYGDLTQQVATVVERLTDAGAILIGKMDTSEFATGSARLFGDLPHPLAANPWNLDYYAGGSSTGPGSGVGGRTTLFSIGGDTGGSIRLPAASCGVQGLKPTFGRVSNHGALANTWSRDCAGPIAWRVADLGIVLEAIGGFDPRDATTVKVEPYRFDATVPESLSGRRVGVVDLDHTDYAEMLPEMREGVEKAIDILRSKGAEIVTVSLPSALPEYASVASTIGAIEFNVSNYDLIMKDPGAAAQGTLGRLPRLNDYSAMEFGKAKRRAAEMSSELELMFAEFDVLVLPGTFYTAGRFGTDETVRFMSAHAMNVASVTSHPALTMRSGFSSDGLPLNVQLISPLFDEAALIRYGMLLEPDLDGSGPRRLPEYLEELAQQA